MNLRLRIGTRVRTLKIHRTAARLEFSLDGQGVAADVVEVESGVFSVLIGGQAFEVCVEASGGNVRIHIDGHEHAVQMDDARQWERHTGTAANAQGRQQVLAPMPGKVIRLLVKPGDSVELGQGLLVLEAMKMQNEIKSPKSGSVERLLVVEGQTVNVGETVAVII